MRALVLTVDLPVLGSVTRTSERHDGAAGMVAVEIDHFASKPSWIAGVMRGKRAPSATSSVTSRRREPTQL